MAGASEKLQASNTWRRIHETFLLTGTAGEVLHGLTEATDTIAIEAYRSVVESSLRQPAAILAVGAYGRGETFPYSGADIVIVLESGRVPEPLKISLANLARFLLDAGLRLNYSVHSFGECLDVSNLELTVNLMDQRFLAGDRSLQARLEARLPAVWDRHSQDIRKHLCQAARSRYTRFGNTSGHLEPDVKEGPGGLHDLRLISRLARLLPDAAPSHAGLERAAETILAARCFLHYRAQADRNVLDLAAQEGLPWMPEYYRSARLIFQQARRAADAAEQGQGSLLDNLRDYRSRLSNTDFTVSRDRLLLRNPSQIAGDSELIFRMLEFVGRHGVALSPDTERRLENAHAVFAAQCAGRPLWPVVQSILSAPYAPMVLRTLHNTNLLSCLFPGLGSIESLPLTEPGHRYIADEHALAAIECVSVLQSSTDPSLRRFSELLVELDQAALLFTALLYYRLDTALAALRMPPADHETVLFVIRHQADFAAAIAGRDLEDLATARSLAARVETIERLKLLTVFTYAQIMTGRPDDRMPWRLEQLSRAYSVTRQELTRELETERIQQVPAGLPEHAEFIKGFPTRYLHVHPSGEIETHLQLYERSRPTGVAVQLEPMESAYRLTIVARDRPSLFAAFAGAITSFGLNILKAEAFSNAKGIVLDTFVFADPKRMLQLNPSESDRLLDLIQRVALGKTDVRRLLREPPRQEARKRFPPAEVRFDSNACDAATLVEIAADDRPGLLYSLATAISIAGCNIDVVLIDTKGRRALDVFYVSFTGRKLPPEVQASLEQSLLSAC